MDRVWTTVSFLCILTAAGLLWSGRSNAMFVVAAIGAVCWFLSFRVRMRRIVDEADRVRQAEALEYEGDDD